MTVWMQNIMLIRSNVKFKLLRKQFSGNIGSVCNRPVLQCMQWLFRTIHNKTTCKKCFILTTSDRFKFKHCFQSMALVAYYILNDFIKSFIKIYLKELPLQCKSKGKTCYFLRTWHKDWKCFILYAINVLINAVVLRCKKYVCKSFPGNLPEKGLISASEFLCIAHDDVIILQ